MAITKSSSTPTPKSKAAKRPARPTVDQPVVDTPVATARSRSQLMVSRVGRFITRSSLPELMLIATLCYARYLKNSDFSYPSEVILNIVLLGAIVSAAYYLYRLILRRNLAAHVAGLLLAYGLYGFTYTFARLHRWGDALIPNDVTSFTHAALQTLFLGIIFGVIGFAIARVNALSQFKTIPVLKFLVFVICFIFAVQVIKVGGRVWTIRHDLAYKQPASSLVEPTKTAAAAASKPNVYYLLFDRYANATTLKNLYNYDNSPLLTNLTTQGFVVRDDAYANYPFTMQSISSTLSGGYHTKVGAQFKNDASGFQTAFPYRKILDNSPVTQAFQTNGYQYNQVSSWWDFTRDNPSADTNPSKSFRLRLFGKNFWMTDLQRDIVNKSVLSPFLLKGLTIGKTMIVQFQLDRNPPQNFYAETAAVKDIAKHSASQTKPQFTFAHFLSPHDPYIFDAQGNAPTYSGDRNDQGVDERVKYTNQVTYLNTQITDLLQSIRQNDPKAAIVLQADEGPYPKQFRGTLTPGHYYDPVNLPLAQQRQKFGVLAAYYLPDTDEQTVRTNITASANTFRYVLNRYVGYDLAMLPDCQFTAGDKYNLFTYSLVSGKLKGTAEPANCQPYK